MSVRDMDTNELAIWIRSLGKSKVWETAAATIREVLQHQYHANDHHSCGQIEIDGASLVEAPDEMLAEILELPNPIFTNLLKQRLRAIAPCPSTDVKPPHTVRNLSLSQHHLITYHYSHVFVRFDQEPGLHSAAPSAAHSTQPSTKIKAHPAPSTATNHENCLTNHDNLDAVRTYHPQLIWK